jgi:hypothetical protein
LVFGDDLGQYRGGKIARYADTQRRNRWAGGKDIQDLIVDAQHAAGIVDHELAFLGQRNPGRALVE